jgi:hypothetical protein
MLHKHISGSGALHLHGVLERGKEDTGDPDTNRFGKQSASIARRFTNIYRYINFSYISRYAMEEE